MNYLNIKLFLLLIPRLIQRQNSEELRLDASKRLLDECIQTQKEQVKEKLRQEFMIREMEQSIHDEEKRKREKEDVS